MKNKAENGANMYIGEYFNAVIRYNSRQLSINNFERLLTQHINTLNKEWNLSMVRH